MLKLFKTKEIMLIFIYKNKIVKLIKIIFFMFSDFMRKLVSNNNK